MRVTAKIYRGLLSDKDRVLFLVQQKNLIQLAEYILTWNSGQNLLVDKPDCALKQAKLEQICIQSFTGMFESAAESKNPAMSKQLLQLFTQGSYKKVTDHIACHL